MSETKRKVPVQSRAVHTVETLLDAAAQVLQSEGEQRFTTNRVAEAAGFSIGTLYQYFPDKDSLAEALARRECARVEAAIRHAVALADPNDLEDVIRRVVVTTIDALGGRTKARRFLILRMARLGHGQAITTALNAVGTALVATLVESDRFQVRPLSDAAIFVLTRTLAGAVRAAVLEESKLLKTRAFEDELVTLALRFLRP